MAGFVVEHESIQVPVSFIERHLKDANGAFVKVYLYILTLATKNRDASYGEIAGELSLIESDVVNAINYWKGAGVLKEDGGRIIIGGGSPVKAPEPERAEKKATGKARYDSSYVAKKITEDSALSDMMGLSQDIFGRILTTAEMSSLFWFHDELGFSPEAVLLLLEYCISKGKNSMKYIEKVAVSWSEKGATQADRVVEIIEEDEKKNGYLYSIRKLLGIVDRPLSQSEERFLMKWKNELDMGEEMVALAYEYCVIQTAKLSFPYMDKIIERWAKQGIRDVLAAEEDNKNFKGKRSATPKNESSEFDDLEMLTRRRIEEE